MEVDRGGHDTQQARELLRQFTELQAMHVADRNRLRAELVQAARGLSVCPAPAAPQRGNCTISAFVSSLRRDFPRTGADLACEKRWPLVMMTPAYGAA
jgi:hypothetical protein